jgi:hypothetical protein
MPRRPYPEAPAFWRLVKLEKNLMRLQGSHMVFSTTRLKSMGIERAPQLDIDNPNAVDADPDFFQPLANTPDLRHAFAETLRQWEERTPDWVHCPDELEHLDRLSCANHLSRWLSALRSSAVRLFDLQPPDVPEWHINKYVFF